MTRVHPERRAREPDDRDDAHVRTRIEGSPVPVRKPASPRERGNPSTATTGKSQTGPGRLSPIMTCGNANTVAPASAATDTTIGTPPSSHATTP